MSDTFLPTLCLKVDNFNLFGCFSVKFCKTSDVVCGIFCNFEADKQPYNNKICVTQGE